MKTTERYITNFDPKRGPKKALWFVDSAEEQPDPVHKDKPSRYGPKREYVANCVSAVFAELLMEAWNDKVAGVRGECPGCSLPYEERGDET